MGRMEGRSMDIIHPKYDPSMKEEPEKPKPKPKSSPQKQVSKQSGGGDSFWPMYLVGVLVVAVIVFFGVRAASSLVDVWTDLSPSTINESAATEETVATEATAEEVAAEAVPVEETAVAEEAAPAVTEAAPATSKTDMKIRILNGSGQSGAAATGQETLEAAGFTIDSVGNAKKFNYTTTIVYYPAGKAANAQLVADALTSYSVSTEENSVADGYDALVVIGDK